MIKINEMQEGKKENTIRWLRILYPFWVKSMPTKESVKMESVLADAGFTLGENYAAHNNLNVESFIPVHGGYKIQREGFNFDKGSDSYYYSEWQKMEFVHLGKAGECYKRGATPR
jgi:hypothetical protein